MNEDEKTRLLNIAIGQQIGELLFIKFNKQGKTGTNWGPKTVESLGASIIRLIQEETERLNNL
jgi:hypothetical protein